MRIFRHLTIAIVFLASLAMAVPALAQSTNTAPGLRLWPTFAPELTKTTTAAPATPAAMKQQGLGIFVQGGYVYTTITGQDINDFHPQGFLVGVGFGGNKSGTFGVGVDINWVWKSDSEGGDSLTSQYVNIPVYGRFNIGGHNTKNAFTFYIPAGWFFDILVSSKFAGQDIKDIFNGFTTGPMVGAGFEVARIAVEGRAQWAVTDLLKADQETAGKPFSIIVLLKVRLN